MPHYSLPEIFPGLIQRSLITKKKLFLNTPCNVQHTANKKKVPIILKKFILLLGTHNSQSNASIIYLCLVNTAIPLIKVQAATPDSRAMAPDNTKYFLSYPMSTQGRGRVPLCIATTVMPTWCQPQESYLIKQFYRGHR